MEHYNLPHIGTLASIHACIHTCMTADVYIGGIKWTELEFRGYCFLNPHT